MMTKLIFCVMQCMVGPLKKLYVVSMTGLREVEPG